MILRAGLLWVTVQGILRELQATGLNKSQFCQKSARNETFCETLKLVFCPLASFNQFILLITLVDIALYVATVCYMGISNDGFIAPQQQALYIFGEKYPYYMRYEYHFHRFIMPMFLHADFVHLFSNMFTQLIIGSMLESQIGKKNFIPLYLLSGLGGILFSSLIVNTPSVSYLILFWNIMDPNSKCSLILFVFLATFINFGVGAANPRIDNLGHLGGLISGIVLGLVFIKGSQQETWQNKARKFGIIATLLFFFGGITLFYTVRQPSK